MDDYKWDNSDHSDDENEEVDKWHGREGMIFLVDVRQTMFNKDDIGGCHFRSAIECCKTTMLNKVIQSDRDMIGIVLFGTRDKDKAANPNHVATLQPLGEPSAEKIKHLEWMLESEDFDDFETKFGHCNEFSLAEALWHCQSLLHASAVKLGGQHILLFTNDPHPHESNTVEQHKARKRAGDLSKFGVDLELLHLGPTFKPDLFYQELVQIVKGEDDGFCLPDSTERFDELMERVIRRAFKKRSVGKLLFHLGPDLSLGVALYNFYRRCLIKTHQKLDRATNEVVKSVRETVHADTSEVMLHSDIVKYTTVSDERIRFTSDEKKKLCEISAPGLTLLGFKPIDRLKFGHYISPSSFIFPEEDLVAGSRVLFAALLNRCEARQVTAICSLVSRFRGRPRLVALLPQLEKLNSKGEQTSPAGFHLFYLPYADEIRCTLPYNIETSGTTSWQVDRAKAIVKMLKMRYVPGEFRNPKLQMHWANIEALALQHSTPRTITDDTLPDKDEITERLSNLSLEFTKAVFPSAYNPLGKVKAGPVKRTATTSTSSRPTKQVKGADMIELATNGKVDKCKVDELKAFLENEGICIPKRTLKEKLVDMVYETLKAQGKLK